MTNDEIEKVRLALQNCLAYLPDSSFITHDGSRPSLLEATLSMTWFAKPRLQIWMLSKEIQASIKKVRAEGEAALAIVERSAKPGGLP